MIARKLLTWEYLKTLPPCINHMSINVRQTIIVDIYWHSFVMVREPGNSYNYWLLEGVSVK